MGKKYLLTFSLAAISCLATKKIQSALEVEFKEQQQIEIVNNEALEVEPQAQLGLSPRLKIY